MNDNEKSRLIDSIGDIDEPSEEHFKVLKKLSSDKDNFIRSQCAAQLINFRTDESLRLLLLLINDKDSFVRTEAYDSMCVFKGDKVEGVLKNAIINEPDNLARRYAILSWIDVVSSSGNATDSDRLFLKNQKEAEDAPDCCLSCCYGLYLFGDREELEQILSFLHNEDYHVRCMTLALLEEIIDETNKKHIGDSIKILLINEPTVAVKDRAESVIKEMSL